jgi:hypothetical protein
MTHEEFYSRLRDLIKSWNDYTPDPWDDSVNSYGDGIEWGKESCADELECLLDQVQLDEKDS